jgi:hypothetical protein
MDNSSKEKTMARGLKESNSEQHHKRQKKADQPIARDQQEPTHYLDLDSGLLDLIVLDEAGGQARGYRPNLTLLRDRDTGEVVRMKFSKLEVTAQ